MNSRQRRKAEAEKHNLEREKKAAAEKRWAELLAGAEPENDAERFALARYKAQGKRARRTAAALIAACGAIGHTRF